MKLFAKFCGVALFLSVGLQAQSAISIPWVGLAQGPLGELRYVRGVAGSFITGEIAAEGVLSSACSAQICLVKTADSILSIRSDGAEPTITKDQIPDGPAVFALSDDHAWIYFPGSGVLSEWKDGVTAPPTSWPGDGDVLSMRVVAGQLELAVRRDGQIWIVHIDDSVVDTLPAAGAVLLIDSAKIYSTSEELVVRRADASETRMKLRGVQSIVAMGPHYAQVVAADGTYLLRTDAGREGLFLLPAAAPASENEARPRRR